MPIRAAASVGARLLTSSGIIPKTLVSGSMSGSKTSLERLCPACPLLNALAARAGSEIPLALLLPILVPSLRNRLVSAALVCTASLAALMNSTILSTAVTDSPCRSMALCAAACIKSGSVGKSWFCATRRASFTCKFSVLRLITPSSRNRATLGVSAGLPVPTSSMIACCSGVSRPPAAETLRASSSSAALAAANGSVGATR